jgi:uncharacterized membrane protein
VFPLFGLGIWILLHRKTPVEIRWVTALILLSLLLTLLVEFVVLKGDIGRSNTVFKFYLQAWVMFGVAGATGLGFIFQYLMIPGEMRSEVRERTSAGEEAAPVASAFGKLPRSVSGRIHWAWWGTFTLLILAGLLYPLAAARAKMNDRYVAGSPPGLNGMNYMLLGATYDENNQPLDLRWDFEAIQWLRENVEGSPVIMEGNTGLYRWGNRFSIYTGLPAVMGWDWHTKQQYSLIPGDLVDYRVGLVREFYNTTDQSRAMEIARRYEVSYVIVGGLERAVYDANGLQKFEQASDQWKLIYQNDQVEIYQVR